MKRLVKAILKALWRSTQPLRRPILRKVENFLARCFRPTAWMLADETNALMEHVVRELVRLQRQVDSLQQVLEDLAPARGELTIAGEHEPEETLKAG